MEFRVMSARASWLLLWADLEIQPPARLLRWEMHSRLGLGLLSCYFANGSLLSSLPTCKGREGARHLWDIPWGGKCLPKPMPTLLCYRLPLNLIILKALNRTMHAILYAFLYQLISLCLAVLYTVTRCIKLTSDSIFCTVSFLFL